MRRPHAPPLLSSWSALEPVPRVASMTVQPPRAPRRRSRRPRPSPSCGRLRRAPPLHRRRRRARARRLRQWLRAGRGPPLRDGHPAPRGDGAARRDAGAGLPAHGRGRAPRRPHAKGARAAARAALAAQPERARGLSRRGERLHREGDARLATPALRVPRQAARALGDERHGGDRRARVPTLRGERRPRGAERRPAARPPRALPGGGGARHLRRPPLDRGPRGTDDHRRGARRGGSRPGRTFRRAPARPRAHARREHPPRRRRATRGAGRDGRARRPTPREQCDPDRAGALGERAPATTPRA